MPQHRRRSLFATAILAPTLTLILAACSGTGGGPYGGGAGAGASTAGASSPAASTAAPAGAGAGGATVSMAMSADHGAYLVGPNGLALYTYDKDSAGTSACSGGCATAWPPLTVTAGQQPTAGDGVTGTLATISRGDGTTQVTYDGLPLYGWQGDTKAGDVTGDGVNGFAVALVSGSATVPSGAASAPASATDAGGYNY